MATHERTIVRVLGATPQERGTTFEVRCCDILAGLGYAGFRSVREIGYEIDIRADHRSEGTVAICECKSGTSSKTPARDINTLVGILDVERRKDAEVKRREEKDFLRVGAETRYQAYFFSLAGFTGEARSADGQSVSDRVHLMDGQDLVDSLIASDKLCSRELAIEGALLAAGSEHWSRWRELEVVAAASGWFWFVRLPTAPSGAEGKMVVLDRSGYPVHQRVAEDLRTSALDLDSYSIAGALPDLDTDVVQEVEREYLALIRAELEHVSLEATIAGEQMRTVQVPFEDYYVPLSFTPGPSAAPDARTVSAADVLVSRKIAICAAPGGGKSTFVARLALAYATSLPRTVAEEQLPTEDLLPLILRCRDLDGSGHPPLRTLLEGACAEVGLSGKEIAFRELVSRAIEDNRVLVLVDGLDELADQSRASLAKRVAAFCKAHPESRVVVTARPAGFRTVAGDLAEVCSQVEIGPLGDDSIRKLIDAWYGAVVGDAPDTHAKAKRLAAQILDRPRLHELAQVPLLLTTLMLINQAVGELPEKRTALYDYALEVLLRTWNIQGHPPLDPGEVVPRLAYVAYHMMESESRQVVSSDLARLLGDAGRDLAHLVGHKLSVPELIARIESRSGVLVMVGRRESAGRLQPLFEFRHSAFQEYLAALAIADGYSPERLSGVGIADALSSRFSSAAWREVVPLVVALAGPGAEAVVESLTRALRADAQGAPVASEMLAQVLGDQIDLEPRTVDDGCLAIVETLDDSVLSGRGADAVQISDSRIRRILGGSGGARFRSFVDAALDHEDPAIEQFILARIEIAKYDAGEAIFESPAAASEGIGRALHLWHVLRAGHHRWPKHIPDWYAKLASSLGMCVVGPWVEALARPSSTFERYVTAVLVADLGLGGYLDESDAARFLPPVIRAWVDADDEVLLTASSAALAVAPGLESALSEVALSPELLLARCPEEPERLSRPASYGAVALAVAAGLIGRRQAVGMLARTERDVFSSALWRALLHSDP